MIATPKQQAFLAEMVKLAVEAEKMGLLTMLGDAAKAIVEGKPDEAKRRAERAAKAALVRKLLEEIC